MAEPLHGQAAATVDTPARFAMSARLAAPAFNGDSMGLSLSGIMDATFHCVLNAK